MKQKGFFVFSLLIVLIIGIGGFLSQEGYLFFSDSPKVTKNSEDAAANDRNGKMNEQTASQTENGVVEISAIDGDSIGKTVIIQGQITSRYIHDKGHVFLTVEDETSEISVPLFADKGIESELYQEGGTVDIVGTVQKYQGKYEVVPALPEDIRLLEDIEKSITKENLGNTVVLQGEVVSRYEHPEGHLFLTLRLTNGQELEIPIFNTLNPNMDAYQAHAMLEVEGEVSEYKGDLQVIPNSLEAIEEISLGEKSEMVFKEIGAISEENRGEKLLTEGYITDVSENKEGHVFFNLEKDGKKIKTNLFKADTNEIKGRKERIQHAETAKFPVRIVGVVEVYKNQLTLIVDKVLID